MKFTYVNSTFHFKWKHWLDHRKHMNNCYTDIVDYDTIKRVTVRVGPFYWTRHYMDHERRKKWDGHAYFNVDEDGGCTKLSSAEYTAIMETDEVESPL